MTVPLAVPASACPECSASTVTTGRAQPWCPSCDWNLDQATPVVSGWRWLDRRLHRVADRLTAAQFAALADGPLTPRTVTAARVATLAAAAVLLAGTAVVAALGVWLLVRDFFSLSTVLGGLLIGVAVVLRPRLGSVSDLSGHGVLVDQARTPHLSALVKRVATAVGAPVPQQIMIGYDLNAFTTTVGVRRTRVLAIGLPLWATLDPQERVALIGHELGHFVNGDVRRGPLIQVAETTLARVAGLFATDGGRGGGIIELVATWITRTLGRLVSATALLLQLLLVWLSQRDSQRAEYLADEMGARAGGTEAATGLADFLVMGASIDTVVRREARAGNGMPAWREAARVARTNLAAQLPVLRKVSRRTKVSLDASHPPAGLRAEMIERRPWQTAAVTLTESEAACIDDELAVHQRRVLTELAQ